MTIIDAGIQGNRSNGVKKSSGAGAGAGSGRDRRHSPAAVTPTPRLKASRSNFTVPQPFSLTTEKRATAAGSKPADNAAPTPPSTKKKITPRKPDVPAAKSVAASTPSPDHLTPRSKIEFVFKSDERAQKRMEFYANLTEKTKAREAERSRIQASTQQQVAAEIKKLRKDQTFKATPMPKFYQEPPPVRIDVKKTPPTRPKSPKLGRKGPSPLGSESAPPSIHARRSSDEFDVSKVPDQQPVSSPETTPAIAPAHENHRKAVADEAVSEAGSEHSSRKSGNSLVPKAALSEDEDHHHDSSAAAAASAPVPKAALSVDEDHPVVPKAALSVDEDHPVPKAALSVEDDHHDDDLLPALAEDGEHQQQQDDHAAHGNDQQHYANGLNTDHSVETPGRRGDPPLDEDLDPALQLPVSSSLLNGSDDEDGHHDELGSDVGDPEEFPSPVSDQFVENDHEQENVRVYISEEFRQAAAAAAAANAAEHQDEHDGDHPDDEQEEEFEGGEDEEQDEEDDDESSAKVYVHMDGMRGQKEGEAEER